jgi:hypothetical protein
MEKVLAWTKIDAGQIALATEWRQHISTGPNLLHVSVFLEESEAVGGGGGYVRKEPKSFLIDGQNIRKHSLLSTCNNPIRNMRTPHFKRDGFLSIVKCRS